MRLVWLATEEELPHNTPRPGSDARPRGQQPPRLQTRPPQTPHHNTQRTHPSTNPPPARPNHTQRPRRVHRPRRPNTRPPRATTHLASKRVRTDPRLSEPALIHNQNAEICKGRVAPYNGQSTPPNPLPSPSLPRPSGPRSPRHNSSNEQRFSSPLLHTKTPTHQEGGGGGWARWYKGRGPPARACDGRARGPRARTHRTRYHRAPAASPANRDDASSSSPDSSGARYLVVVVVGVLVVVVVGACARAAGGGGAGLQAGVRGARARRPRGAPAGARAARGCPRAGGRAGRLRGCGLRAVENGLGCGRARARGFHSVRAYGIVGVLELVFEGCGAGLQRARE